MADIRVVKTPIEGLVVIEPTKFGDDRGYFMETYNLETFHKNGLDMEFIQDNESKSKRGVLRGLHFQSEYSQGKLVRCTKGSVWDVGVDLRKDSDTFGKWYGVELTEDNKKMFYIPEGFAHGFIVLSDEAVFNYKCTNLYHPEFDGGVRWDDPEIGVVWPDPGCELLLSEKDTKQPLLS